jgi:D-tyrosyl-tRNA(Tyr) deacylase
MAAGTGSRCGRREKGWAKKGRKEKVRAVVQRVSGASVSVDGREVSRIGRGLLVFLGVAAGDGPEETSYVAGKIAGMRVFSDADGKMNLSVGVVGGEILVVSQFTLLADLHRGRRPSFTAAAPPADGERIYEDFVSEVARRSGCRTGTGIFGANMQVMIANDGPVTFVLDSRE